MWLSSSSEPTSPSVEHRPSVEHPSGRHGAWSRIRRGSAMAVAATLLIGTAACSSSGSSANGSQSTGASTLSVVASINQWGSLAKELGGRYVSVTSVMTNTSVEAHDYEPTTQNIAAFSTAKVTVVNGADYDPWAVKAASSSASTLVNAAESGDVAEGGNPHVWFSSKVRKATADAITAAYEKNDPDHSAKYRELNDQWKDKEKSLEASITAARAKTSGARYAATESVAWYLADDLGMTDATPKGYSQAVANEGEPSASDVVAFTKALASGDISLLILNTQETNSVTSTISAAATTSKVPIVKLTEQMPAKYATLNEWMEALVGQFSQTA